MEFTLGRRGVAVAAGAVLATVVAIDGDRRFDRRSDVQPPEAQGLGHGRWFVDGRPLHDGCRRAVPARRRERCPGYGRHLRHGRRLPALLQGEIDLADASRPLRNSEAATCKTNNVGSWRAFTVANDALTVVVNQQNTWARCLTVAELKKIWEPGSKIDNWKDVRASFPDVPLKLFGAGTDSGTFDYFTEAINGRARASRTDYQASEDDNVTVQGVSGERGGMGYFGFSYTWRTRARLNAIQVANPKSNQCVAPSVASVQNNTYKPLGRPLFIYAKGSSFKRQEVQAFLDYIFDNEVAIARRSDFISLTPKQLKRARTNFSLAVKAANRTWRLPLLRGRLSPRSGLRAASWPRGTVYIDADRYHWSR